ncbi:hypothetical protein ACSS6W_000791 [Trichoderma asperelloides]
MLSLDTSCDISSSGKGSDMSKLGYLVIILRMETFKMSLVMILQPKGRDLSERKMQPGGFDQD